MLKPAIDCVSGLACDLAEGVRGSVDSLVDLLPHLSSTSACMMGTLQCTAHWMLQAAALLEPAWVPRASSWLPAQASKRQSERRAAQMRCAGYLH